MKIFTNPLSSSVIKPPWFIDQVSYQRGRKYKIQFKGKKCLYYTYLNTILVFSTHARPATICSSDSDPVVLYNSKIFDQTVKLPYFIPVQNAASSISEGMLKRKKICICIFFFQLSSQGVYCILLGCTVMDILHIMLSMINQFSRKTRF